MNQNCRLRNVRVVSSSKLYISIIRSSVLAYIASLACPVKE